MKVRHWGLIRRRTLAAATPLLALLLAGCGIRATSVPTEYGPAPSRASCAPAEQNVQSQAARGVSVQIFLVCTSQLVAVDRTVSIADDEADDPVRVAQALLDQLRRRPATPEKQAGYTTAVRDGMTVSGARRGEPAETLRLDTPPSDLTAYALAQIVCTFANSAAAADDGSVVLGGDKAPLERYRCTPEVRSRPGTTAPPTSPVRGQSG